MISVFELPVDSNPALTTSETSAWSQLLDFHLSQVILCAFCVMEERRGNAGEPYAVRSILG